MVPAALELRLPATGLLDDPLLPAVHGAGTDAALTWRARLHDDDGRVWRAQASRGDRLADRWVAAKATTGGLAALQSLRPVRIEVRVEAPDGRTATRQVTRRLVADGVRLRRWRDGLGATLCLPIEPLPCATLLIDATAGPAAAAVATLAAPLLASRGVLVLAVAGGRGGALSLGGVEAGAGDDGRSEASSAAGTTDGAASVEGDGPLSSELLAVAAERLARVPGAGREIVTLPALAGELPDDGAEAIVLPPGIPSRGGDEDKQARVRAWDALLARLSAYPRAAAKA